MNLKTGHRFEIFETIFLAINILTWHQRTFLLKWSDGVCQSKSEIQWWSPPWRLANNKLRWIQCRPPKAEPYTVMKRWGPFSPWWFCDFLVEINCTCSPLHNQCQFCLPWRPWFHLLSMSRRCRALTDHQWPLRESKIWTVEHKISHLKWLLVTPSEDAAWESLGWYGGPEKARDIMLYFCCWSLVCAQLHLDKVDNWGSWSHVICHSIATAVIPASLSSG